MFTTFINLPQIICFMFFIKKIISFISLLYFAGAIKFAIFWLWVNGYCLVQFRLLCTYFKVLRLITDIDRVKIKIIRK